MTFLHKLAHRLARQRKILILAAVVAIACEIPMRQSDPTGARLELSPQTLMLRVGSTTQFVAVGFTSAGDTAQLAVAWSATGGSIVDTSTSGGKHYTDYKAPNQPGQYKVIIQASVPGSTTQSSIPLSPTSAAAELTDSAVVNVTAVPVSSVSVSPAPASAIVGQTVQLTATALDSSGAPLSGRTVTWTTSNSGIATVSASGLVTGVAVGAATITATSEGKSGTAAVTVTPPPVASVTVNPPAVGATVGDQAQFTTTLQDVNGNVLTGRVVTWASNNTSVATVNGSGLVTTLAAGLSIITATSEGKNGTAGITVTLTAVPVASVSVTPASPSVTAGQTVQLTATPRDASGNVLLGRVVTWATSDASRATVSSSGLVTGVAAGAVTITATSEGQSGSSAVTVLAPVATVAVSPASPSVIAGQTVQLTATTRDASGNLLTGRLVTWVSSNAAIATVSSSGLVRGVAQGSATITATSEGKNGTAAVTVTQAPVATVSVAPASTTVPVGQTLQLTATTRDASGNILTGRVVTWASSNTGLATVNTNGLVTGVAVGAVTITATSEGQSGSSAVTVQAAGTFAPPDILSVDFQNGTFGPLINNYSSGIVIMDDPTGAGFGKVARFQYHVSGPGNQDSNTSLDYTYPVGKTDLYHRIYVYFADPGTQGGVVVEKIPSGLQRKLIYINAGEGPDYWTGTIQRWLDGATGTMANGIYGPRSVTKSGQPQFTEIEVTRAIDVKLNTWYYFEYRVKLNTPGQSDGRIQIWGGIKGAPGLANALLYDVQNANIRYSSTNGYLSVRFGQQLDAFTNSTYTIDDIRYLKNIAISTQRIGP